MKRKSIIALLVLATTLLLSLAPGLIAQVETRSVLSFTEEDLRVRVYAPYQTYPGDTIEVRVDAEALEDLIDVTITVGVFGSKSEAGKEGYDSWEDEISVVDGVDWDADEGKDKKYDVDIPSDSDPGLVYGHITAEWTTAADDIDHTYAESFTITYVMNKDYEELQEDYKDLSSKYDKLKADYDKLTTTYNNLQTTYNSLKSDYDSLNATFDSLTSEYDTLESDYKTLLSEKDALQKKYNSLDSEHKALQAEYDALGSEYEATVGELSNYKTYMYALAVTTVIFVITTIIFAVRKPKTV